MTSELLIWGENGSYRIDYSRIPQATENARIYLKTFVGAGGFELPTLYAESRLRYAAEMPNFQALEFQADTRIQLKPVEPCWAWKRVPATKPSTVHRHPWRRNVPAGCAVVPSDLLWGIERVKLPIMNGPQAGLQPTQSADEELERLKAEITALKVELQETRQSTNQYLQNVAHQLTAPLNAIKWNIEAIKDEHVTIPRKMKLLSSIYSQGTILVHLIKNFSLMSNLEADHELGQFRDKPERVDILRLAINLSNDFQPQAAEGGKKLIVDESSFNRVLRGKSVLAVKNLIAQALSNLLENAVKYTDLKTTIEIEATSVCIVSGSKPLLGIAVRSIGLPISPDEIKKVQSRGFRGTAAKQKIPAGTGIGLYIAKRIMEMHQGTIYIRTRGKESTFTLLFPESRIK